MLKTYPLQRVSNVSVGVETYFTPQFLPINLPIFEFQFRFSLIWDKNLGPKPMNGLKTYSGYVAV